MSSLKSLAQQLDLSITTVSRALDGYPDVASATRERVRSLAASLNYHPHAAARSLRKQKAEAVAVILPAGTSHIGLAGLIDTLMQTGRHLAARGIDLLMLPTLSPEADLAALRRLVDGRRADAVIVVRTRRQDERVDYLARRGVPFLTHGRTQMGLEHAFIDGDGAAGFEAATRSLIALGHQRIAHLSAPQEFMFAATRRSGWLRAMHGAGLAGSAVERSCRPDEIGGHAGALDLLAGPERPTALLCASDAMAIGALRAVRELSLVPGRDVSIVGHDDLPSAAFTDPPLTTMTIDASDIGDRVGDMLIQLIGGADASTLQSVLPIRQIPRQTHGALRRATP